MSGRKVAVAFYPVHSVYLCELSSPQMRARVVWIFCSKRVIMPAHGRGHQLSPAIADEFLGEEFSLATEFFRLGVHVVHELVDQRDGDPLDLRLGIGNFANEDVTSSVDAALGIGVEHLISFIYMEAQDGQD